MKVGLEGGGDDVFVLSMEGVYKMGSHGMEVISSCATDCQSSHGFQILTQTKYARSLGP